MKKINRHFVSEIDKAMAKFNKTHELSASQRKEKEKYAKIHGLRDNPTELPLDDDSLWD